MGLGIAISFAPGDAALAVDVYLLFVGTLALLLAITRTLGTLPREGVTALDRGRRSQHAPRRPRELVKLERSVALSTETAFDAHFRLRPTLRMIAAARLGRRGIDLDSPTGPAGELLGREAWEIVKPDTMRPRAHDAPGFSYDDIRAAVDALEKL